MLIGRRIIETLSSHRPVFAPEFAFTGAEDTDFFVRASRHGAKIDIAEASIINKHYEDLRLTPKGMLQLAFCRGGNSVRIARRYDLSPDLRRRKFKAIIKIVVGLFLLPVSIFSKVLLARRLYQISYGLGMLCAFSGRQADYYR